MLNKSLALHLTKYDNQIMFRDLNVGEDEINMPNFCSSHHLRT